MLRPLWNYCTTTVAALVPDCDFTVPTVTTTGTVPVGEVAGMVTLTCMTPDTRPGAEPAYCTTASTPPMVAVTGSSGFFKAEATAGMMAAIHTLRVGLAFAGHIDGDDVAALFGIGDAIYRDAVLIEDGARAGTLLVERVNAGGGQHHIVGEGGGLHTGVFDDDVGGGASVHAVRHHDAGLARGGVDDGRRPRYRTTHGCCRQA